MTLKPHVAGVQQRYVLDPGSIEKVEILSAEQIGIAQDTKILDGHQDRRIGAAFGMNTTNGDAHCFPHDIRSYSFGLRGTMAAKRSQFFSLFGVHAASAIAGRRGKTRRLK